MNELKINGLKGLETIPDITLYLFILLIIVSIIILSSLIYLLYRSFKTKNNPRKVYYKKLQELDLNDTKNSAYKMSKCIKELAKNDREIKLAQELISDLEKYKYKKNVEAFDSNIHRKYELFMDNIDV